jgi:hypothetical protein
MMDVYPAHYYDIYSEWIPSSNFANRPMDEICDLHVDGERLWTFMDSDNSSSDDEGPDRWPAPRLQDPEPQKSYLEHSVAAVKEGSCNRPLQRRRRCSSDLTVSTQRSYTDALPVTALLDGCSPGDHAPQLPRRAISARLERSSFGIKRTSYHKDISQRLRRSGSGLGATAIEPQDDSGSGVTQKPQLLTSISQKLRAKKVLNASNMARLKTDNVCLDTRARLDSATSMMSTPHELYSWSRQAIRETELDGVSCNQPGSQTPMSPKTALSSVGAGVDDPHIWGREDNVRDVLAPGKRRVYVPGPIMLEQHPAMLRTDSVASMDMFLDDLGPKQRRTSDTMVMDQIASFFDEPGVGEQTTETGLDKYWLNEEVSYGQPSSQATGVLELAARPPWAPRSCLGERQPNEASAMLSRFSFSSASSPPSVAPSRRQRLRLRRLLLPALPGSTFLKGAGSLGAADR